MKGHVFLKVTGILMIIAAAFSIIVGVLLAGISALAAGLGAASGLKFTFWAALFLTLVGGIRQTHRLGRHRGCVQHFKHRAGFKQWRRL